jgi:hypothetical protein
VVGPEGEFHTAIPVELFKTGHLALYDLGNKVLVRGQRLRVGLPERDSRPISGEIGSNAGLTPSALRAG